MEIKYKEVEVTIKEERPTPEERLLGSGQVPEGDVRLTANVDAGLHLRLKLAAARERTTIGEMIEEMIRDRYPNCERSQTP